MKTIFAAMALIIMMNTAMAEVGTCIQECKAAKAGCLNNQGRPYPSNIPGGYSKADYKRSYLKPMCKEMYRGCLEKCAAFVDRD